MLDRLDAKSRITQRNRWSFGLEGSAADDVSVHVDGRDLSELDCVLGFAGSDWESVGVSRHCDGDRRVPEYQIVFSALCGRRDKHEYYQANTGNCGRWALSLIHISEPTRPY